MAAADDKFLEQLRATFQVEAQEHLQSIAEGLLGLEAAPAPDAARPLIERVFRAAHSLKGAARAVDLTEVELRCQSLEDTFAQWKRQQQAPSRPSLDAAHRVLDAITAHLSGPAARPDKSASSPAPPAYSAPAVPSFPAIPVEPFISGRAAAETVRVTVSKLDARLVEAEEMLTAKLAVGQRARELGELAEQMEQWRKKWATAEPSARILRRKLERATADPGAGHEDAGQARLIEFLDWNADYFRRLETSVQGLARVAQQDRHTIGKLVDDLLEDSKKLLLLPFSTLAGTLPKLVRDLCRDQGKDADLVVRGDDVEIDKRTLEEMKDPLIHLLRNCVDHGLESPEERMKSGKPPRGKVTVAASRVNGSKVELLVSDDGRGIDYQKVKDAAVRGGLFSTEDARQMSDAQASALVFKADVTTSPVITRISGRGLGLAIVKESAEKLGGSVSVESQFGHGTAFRLILPAVRATFRGILVEAAQRTFVVPTVQVERVTRVKPDDLQTVEGRETISLNGAAIAFVRLADVLGLPPAKRESGENHAAAVLIVGNAEERLAFEVDAVLAEQEVLVKPLRKPLGRVRNIAGATVLGSGQIAPILSIPDLLKSARKAGAPSARPTITAPSETEPHAASILVAEDSITSRMLLKGILESAGYMVKTAVDGAEAFALLRTEHFDLVVSDVEMPRMNGFALTEKIRADAELSALPVMLVTALETREDRERGIDAGANAYLVKSNFDQGGLLEVVARLI